MALQNVNPRPVKAEHAKIKNGNMETHTVGAKTEIDGPKTIIMVQIKGNWVKHH